MDGRGRVLKKAQVNHPTRPRDWQTDRQAGGPKASPPCPFPPSVFLPSFSLRRLFVRPSRERPNKSESASLPPRHHTSSVFPSTPRLPLPSTSPRWPRSVRPRPPAPSASVRVHNPQSALINGSEVVTPVDGLHRRRMRDEMR